MSSPPLKSLVEHEVRADILSRVDGNPQTIHELSTALEKPERLVGHHVALLDGAGLVKEDGEAGGLARFVANLDEQPSWVKAAVDQHRRRRDG